MQIKKTKVGDLLAVIKYAKVIRVFNDEAVLRDVEDESEFRIIGSSLVEKCLSADQFEETKKVSKTELAEKLVSSFNQPLTVCFDKSDGTERILRGKLLEPEPLLGRSYLEDMDITDKNKTRLVDHRSLKYIIVDGVKYVSK